VADLKKRLQEPTLAAWKLIGAALLLCGSCALADVNMTLTGPGTNGIIGNVYVGPYQGTINGVSTPIICDDFYDDTYLNESWTASVSTFANLSNTKFGAADALQYEQAAWLAQQLVNPASTCPTVANCAGDIQFAMWEVFDNTGSNTPFGMLTGHDLTNAQSWLHLAQTQTFYAGEFSNVTIYSPVSCVANCASWPSQEFMVVATPEPSELALLGVDLTGVGTLFFLLYRRRSRQA
jgi:hypothetical protein